MPLLVTSLVQQLPVRTSSDVSTLWGQLRVWTLRKCLLCARALEDRLDYLSIVLSLLEPVCAQGVCALSVEFRSALQKDFVTLATQNASTSVFNHGGADDEESKTSPTNAVDCAPTDAFLASTSQNVGLTSDIPVNASRHFLCRMSVNYPVGGLSDAEKGPSIRPPSMEVSTGTKLIHDESFKVTDQ